MTDIVRGTVGRRHIATSYHEVVVGDRFALLLLLDGVLLLQ